MLFYVNMAVEDSEMLFNTVQVYKIHKPIAEVFVHQYMSLSTVIYV
jgi:hypothetical protein